MSLYLRVETPEGYALRLLEEGIIVAPGSSFGPGGEGFFRVALVSKLEEYVEAIAWWESRKGQPTYPEYNAPSRKKRKATKSRAPTTR